MFMSNINSLAIEENVVLYAWEDAFMLPGQLYVYIYIYIYIYIHIYIYIY